MTGPESSTKRDAQQDKKKTQFELQMEKTWVQGLVFVGGVLVYLLLGLVLWWVLDQYIKPQDSGEKKDLIQALGLIMAGLAGIVGIYFTWRNLSNAQDQLSSTQDQLQLARQGQITDRFTQAIDQLGKSDDKDPPNKIEEIRLGGIYALEQIAVDEPDKYHWPIMQVFAAYLRRYASWQGDLFKVITPVADTQTVLNVIGQRSRYFGKGEDQRLNFSGMDFSNYTFPDKAHLEGALLRDAHLESAILSKAQLKQADLRGAHLEGAHLVGADLSEADLRGAHLEGAYLLNADLRDADLRNASLTATYLPGAKLPGEEKLDPESLEEANRTYSTERWGSLPGNDATLEPGEYSIKVWNTLLHFSGLGEGWYSSLGLPYSIMLSPAGVTFAGTGISFFSGPWVCDPQKPKELFALVPAPKDARAWVDWFDNHPHLMLPREVQEWENPLGGAPGLEFYVEVNAHTSENELGSMAEGPSVTFFPSRPRSNSFALVKGKTNRVLVLVREDEWMVILTESPPDEFDKFKDRVDEEVLASLYWGKKAYEHLEGG